MQFAIFTISFLLMAQLVMAQDAAVPAQPPIPAPSVSDVMADDEFSKLDMNLTHRIKSEIAADRTLSVEARNVNVETKDGKVTLQGEVRSVDEQTRIERMARNKMGVTQVINQTQIK